MLLLVGLGNPGRESINNRHNIGFMAVDALIARFGLGAPRSRRQPAGLFSEGTIDGEKVIVLKPKTYMNESGRAVGAAMRYWRLTPADVVVFHDDLDLAPGKVRVKRDGGHAGHNGLRSIDAHIGRDYRRVRLGIGHPGDKDRVTGHVLRDFSKADRDWLEPELDAVADALPLLIRGDEPAFMTRVALLTRPAKPKKARPASASAGEESGEKAGGADGA